MASHPQTGKTFHAGMNPVAIMAGIADAATRRYSAQCSRGVCAKSPPVRGGRNPPPNAPDQRPAEKRVRRSHRFGHSSPTFDGDPRACDHTRRPPACREASRPGRGHPVPELVPRAPPAGIGRTAPLVLPKAAAVAPSAAACSSMATVKGMACLPEWPSLPLPIRQARRPSHVGVHGRGHRRVRTIGVRTIGVSSFRGPTIRTIGVRAHNWCQFILRKL